MNGTNRGVVLALLAALNVACSGDEAARGREKILAYGCGACHRIPGVPGARGVVGPPLDRIGRRVYLGGVLANTPGNMVRWLISPHGADPRTAMPEIGLSEGDAEDIAAYLYTLR